MINLMATILICFIGACFGSFICCMIYRKIKGDNLFKPSYCDSCQQKLKPYDLIPIIGFILNKGKCRYCHKQISYLYPVAEIICSLILMLNCIKCTDWWSLIKDTALAYILFYIAVYDAKTCLIDEWAILAGVILWGFDMFINKVTVQQAFSLLVNGMLFSFMVWSVSAIMKKFMKKEVLGSGDIILFFMVGIYNSMIINNLLLFIACMIQLIIFVINKKAKEYLPFAPAIFLSYYLVSVFHYQILNCYYSIISSL